MTVKCQSCDAISEEGSGEPLYECGSCGTVFTRAQSNYGNHQCPDCNKFASKLADDSCAECEEGETEDIAAEWCAYCTEWYEEQDAEEHKHTGEVVEK